MRGRPFWLESRFKRVERVRNSFVGVETGYEARQSMLEAGEGREQQPPELFLPSAYCHWGGEREEGSTLLP